MSQLTLTEALKEHSRTTHDAVDHLVMSMNPFASHDNYASSYRHNTNFIAP
ncbi:Heme oxygenase [Moraxella ovis]|uniref:Heme oxygenase n=1 Tax=Moraxella ovis TaxID=29433 RepID=A0A378PHA6_9GAMM|nr:hypothetical protein [Moraxella ovis]SPX85464.1 Heme oxygenase [Moraxella ovis]STY86194.1 Heme oxygenase [Moraxella ovis]STZ06233.1 Heme oxygenase [Moraxella ovis]